MPFDVTELGEWFRDVTPGITCTMGLKTGKLLVSAISVAEVDVRCTFKYGEFERVHWQKVVRQSDPPSQPTNTGGTGTETGGTGTASGSIANTTQMATTNGSGYDFTLAVSGILKVVAGAAGKIKLTAALSFLRTATTLAGLTGAKGKWRYRTAATSTAAAGAWTDVGGETAAAMNAESEYDTEVKRWFHYQGGFSPNVEQTLPSLVAGKAYEFQFAWHYVHVSGGVSNLRPVTPNFTADGTVT